MENETGRLVRIFIGESDQHDGQPLFHWIVLRAKDAGLAGATVLRGMEGFGASSRLHTASLLRLSQDLPLVIEIVDTETKIEAFLPTIEKAMQGGMITVEKVEIRHYRGADSKQAG